MGRHTRSGSNIQSAYSGLGIAAWREEAQPEERDDVTGRRRTQTFRAFPKGRLDQQGLLHRWWEQGEKCIKLLRTWRVGTAGQGEAPDKPWESGKGPCMSKVEDDPCRGGEVLFLTPLNIGIRNFWSPRNRLS